MPNIKSDALFESIRSGKIHTAYLFDGPEQWLKERAVGLILDKVLPENRDLNLDRFYGDSNSGAQVVSVAQSFPFLAEKRVVVVFATEKFSAADSKIIGETLSHLSPSTVLIFLYEGKAGLREEIPARVNSMGVVVTFWPPFPNQLPTWVVHEVRRRGRTIGYDAARTLAEACTDLQEISNELDKLFLFVGSKKNIELRDVVQHGLPDQMGGLDSLEEALWTRNLRGALQAGHQLAEMGVRAELIFPLFERVLKKLILARYYQKDKGWPLADIYEALRIRGRTKQEWLNSGLRAYSPLELDQSLEKVIQGHMDLKTGLFGSEMAVTFLILDLIKGETRKELAFR